MNFVCYKLVDLLSAGKAFGKMFSTTMGSICSLNLENVPKTFACNVSSNAAVVNQSI